MKLVINEQINDLFGKPMRINTGDPSASENFMTVGLACANAVANSFQAGKDKLAVETLIRRSALAHRLASKEVSIDIDDDDAKLIQDEIPKAYGILIAGPVLLAIQKAINFKPPEKIPITNGSGEHHEATAH